MKFKMNTILICIIFLLLGILLASIIFPNKCVEGQDSIPACKKIIDGREDLNRFGSFNFGNQCLEQITSSEDCIDVDADILISKIQDSKYCNTTQGAQKCPAALQKLRRCQEETNEGEGDELVPIPDKCNGASNGQPLSMECLAQMYAGWTADDNELCDKYVNPLKKVGADLSESVNQFTQGQSGGGFRGDEFATAVQACVADDAPGGLTSTENIPGSPGGTGTVNGDDV